MFIMLAERSRNSSIHPIIDKLGRGGADWADWWSHNKFRRLFIFDGIEFTFERFGIKNGKSVICPFLIIDKCDHDKIQWRVNLKSVNFIIITSTFSYENEVEHIIKQ